MIRKSAPSGQQPRLFALVFAMAVTSTLWLAPALAERTAVPTESEGERALQEGLQLAQAGALEQAVVRLQQAVDSLAQAKRPLRQSDALVALGQVYVRLGYHMKAAQSLELAMTLVQRGGDQGRLAGAIGALGEVYLEVGQFDAASQYLNDGLQLAREIRDDRRSAIIINDLGRLHSLKNDDAKALDAFAESLSLAQAAGLAELAATVTVNAGQASLRLGRVEEAKNWFGGGLTKMRGLPDSHDKAYGLITVGLAYAQLGSNSSDEGQNLVLRAAQVLEEAGDLARAIGDKRAVSYAFGHRGRLYEEQGRYDEALILTRMAVNAAQLVYAPESLYRWQWQTGRLLKGLGRREAAISSYRQAMDTVQKIRPELALTSGETAASFRKSGGRLFFQLADLLLQQAASSPDHEAAQPYLVQARKTVELFKSAELRDYFRDDCVDALQERKKPIEDPVLSGAAVLYPILLQDRTELLVSLPGGIQRFSVPVTSDEITKEVRAFRRYLVKRTTREYLPHAQQLYDWLIRPLEPSLGAHPISTLVVVPDGSLRTIPMAALHDGEQYLVEKYAVATTPGLDLTDPHPLPRERIKVLSAGLTEGVQGFPPLPNVVTELKALEELYGSRPLINKAFLTASLEKQLRDKEFTIVHIASHGKFERQVGDSFVLTFDDKLTMDQLSQVVGYFRFRDEPLELLTLSACETAAGDDRAALGLAGVAIKAGARSALATLWFINDESSSALVAEFYRQLQKPSLSKAQALRNAQVALLKNPRYRHPSYWSPFLLLNNWL